MNKDEKLMAKHRRDFAALQRAERRMVLAFGRWLKLRDQVRRNDKAADRAWDEHLARQMPPGGSHDVRDIVRTLDGPKVHKHK